MVMTLAHGRDGSVRASWQGEELFQYVYRPRDPVNESPRPYFHPVRTLAGDIVSLYRPHDHVWHKGLAWSLSNVGPANFWGGPSWIRGEGYRQLDNNGQMRHDGFAALAADGEVIRIGEQLSWITQQGATWLEEQRWIRASVRPDDGAWQLSFTTAMRNVTGHVIRIGSPTTAGRPDAGYSGLFWRGPRSFSGGTVLTPDGPGGDELMGWRGPWLGFTGRHDGTGHSSTLVFCDHPENFAAPSPWFVRAGVFACVCPAPFFSREYPLDAGETLTLGYDVLIAGGALDAARCGELARQAVRDSGAARAQETWS